MEPIRCPICRQNQIGELEWYDFADLFGFDPEANMTVAELRHGVQRYIRDWQRGVVTLDEMRAQVAASANSG